MQIEGVAAGMQQACRLAHTGEDFVIDWMASACSTLFTLARCVAPVVISLLPIEGTEIGGNPVRVTANRLQSFDSKSSKPFWQSLRRANLVGIDVGFAFNQ